MNFKGWRTTNKSTRSKEMARADKYFSLYIRLKHADFETGTCKCCTCGKVIPWKSPNGTTHAGHYISRKNQSTRYDERNVHPQCISCNSFNEGKHPEYGQFLNETYGGGTTDALIWKSKIACKRTVQDFRFIAEKYKYEFNELLNQMKDDGFCYG